MIAPIIPLLMTVAALNAQIASRAAMSAALSARGSGNFHRHQRDERIRCVSEQENREEIPEVTRAYTIQEIDQMRQDIEWSYGSGSYYPAERSAQTERSLRTYMAAGIDPDEVRKRRDDAMERERKSQEMIQEYYRKQREFEAATTPNIAEVQMPTATGSSATIEEIIHDDGGWAIFLMIVGIVIIAIFTAWLALHK